MPPCRYPCLIRFKTLALAATFLFVLMASGKNLAQNAPIASVTIGGVTYSNVVVESVSAKAISFSHARGWGSLNPKKLTLEQKQSLGLAPQSPAPQPVIASANIKAPPTDLSLSPLSVVPSFAPASAQAFARLAGAFALGIVIGVCVLYLFTCLCLSLICRKAERPSPLLVWIPVLQLLAAYRAAGMSSFWFKAFVTDICFRVTVVGLAFSGSLTALPQGTNAVLIGLTVAFTLLHVIGWGIWCFKICIAREKSALLGILVLLPITQPLALGYLAFSE